MDIKKNLIKSYEPLYSTLLIRKHKPLLSYYKFVTLVNSQPRCLLLIIYSGRLNTLM